MVLARRRQLLLMAVLMTAAGIAHLHFSDRLATTFDGAVRRPSITTSYDDDGFAGRVGIWNERVALLNRNPLFWVAGTGFGSAIESGSNGHMLYLQTTLECGLIGTLAFLLAMWKGCLLLWRQGTGGHILCYATAALLISAVTQETFYPVPAFGHFCGMYLLCVALRLSPNVI